MKLGLGTAQLGFTYGISNDTGQPGRDEAERILARAAECGIGFVDTAPDYGDSEERIGSLRPTECPGFEIVTKTRVLPSSISEETVVRCVVSGVEESLHRLRVSSVHGLLVHRVGNLLGDLGEVLWRCMCDLRERGLAKRIGVSVYSAAEIDSVLARFPIDLIQVPLNVLDQRLVRSGHLRLLKRRGVEIHARSVFLQGILLTEPERLPPEVAGLKARVQGFRDFAAERGSSPVEAALAFVRSVDEVDVALCGVATATQVSVLAEAWRADIDAGGMRALAVEDTLLLDPRTWTEVKA